jgi:N-formylglutamate amidohydrolase
MKQVVIWELHQGDSPLVATAIHNGHALRQDVAKIMALSETERLQEEDPFTGQWAGSIADTYIIGLRSRFEVDLNRPREKAVYLEPEDAWGLQVWKVKPPTDVVKHSLLEYDVFYAEVRSLFTDLERRFGKFIVFDLHTYNHRREGPRGPIADPEQNPEVNVGTGTMDRERWAPIVDRFIADLRAFDFLGRHLDVRENIKFKGGHFSRWAHENFPDSACVLAIEFKKFFMDEWTGKLDPAQRQFKAISNALQSTVPGVLEELKKL